MRRPFGLPLLLALASIEGIILTIPLALIPADRDNAWLLGVSMTRMAMIAASFGLIVLCASLSLKLSRDARWRERADAWMEDRLRSEGWLMAVLTALSAGTLAGAYLTLGAFTATDTLHRTYLERFAPWSSWFSSLCLTGIVFIRVHYQTTWRETMRAHKAALLAILVTLLVGGVVHMLLGNRLIGPVAAYTIMDRDELATPIEDQDIFQVYIRGHELLDGVNPYDGANRVVEGVRTRPSTYLPIMYYLSWAVQRVGFSEPSLWLDVQQGIFLFFNLAVAYLLFHIGYFDYDSLSLGILAALVWLFNRWSLYVTIAFQFEFIPVFLLVASLALWPRYRLASCLLMGASLAVRQMGILLVPLYLIWAWEPRDRRHLRQPVTAAIAIVAIPLLVSLPFILVNARGFIDSIGYSILRPPVTHTGALSLDALLGSVGIAAKVPAMVLILLTYSLAWRRWLTTYTAAMLVLVVFLDFNSVLFNQYVVWIVPLILLAMMDVTALVRKRATVGGVSSG